VTLVATPRLVDPNYRGAVLLAVPVDNNRHVGVIINRPPDARSRPCSLSTPPPSSCAIRCTSRADAAPAIFAVVHTDHTPGPGSIRMMKELFLAIQGAVVDQSSRRRPTKRATTSAMSPGGRGAAPGVDRGLWYVLEADPELVFRKDPARLWEELLRRARR